LPRKSLLAGLGFRLTAASFSRGHRLPRGAAAACHDRAGTSSGSPRRCGGQIETESLRATSSPFALSEEAALSKLISVPGTRFERATDAVLSMGCPVFSLANIALGVETILCARSSAELSGQHIVIPVLPFLPPVPWLAYLFGAIWIACAVGLLFESTVRTASLALGSLLFVSTLTLEVPKYAAHPGSMEWRTGVFEVLAIGTLAWLLPGPRATSSLLSHVSRYLLALSLIVFGVDHFLALAPIGTLIPEWIPWHVFWIAVFGAGFIAAGLSIAFNVLQLWGAFSIGLMFATWVITLHLPRVLGLYAIPGAPRNPAEWSSLFIAIALWGGPCALAGIAWRQRLTSKHIDAGKNLERASG
jgi:uncharacterized membrane protein